MNDLEENTIKEFEKLKPILKKWGVFVDNCLNQEILVPFNEQHILKIAPSYRLKDDISLLNKALYRKKPYQNPFVEIEDKIGTRIVVLKSSDVENVAAEIINSKKWVAKITKDIKREIFDKPISFDYQSLHVVVSPLPDSAEFDINISPYLTCEIQIRTLLQHAFAEVSHDSTYKGPYKNDKEILRHLAKSMALMEATDDYFCQIFSLMSDEKRYYYQYMIELVSLYRIFSPKFNSQSLNTDLTDKIFELLVLKKIEIQDVSLYVEKFKNDLIRIIQPRNGLIFQQPVCLLINYYFQYHNGFLKEHWPLNEEVLKGIFRANDTSFESY